MMHRGKRQRLTTLLDLFHYLQGELRLKGFFFYLLLQQALQHESVFTVDVSTCHCRSRTGVANNIK